MFQKPFRVKSNTKIKSSEKKKFVEQLHKDFALSDEEVALIVGKSEVCKQKLITHREDHVFIFMCKDQPMIIEIDGIRIPTVYMLWLLPQLLPTFTTHDAVVKRLQNGADLMLPGVIPRESPGPTMYGRMPKGLACAINTTSNRSPIAVGYTAMSCEDMYMSAGHGKAVIVTHVLGDDLWHSGDRSYPPVLPWLRPTDGDEAETNDKYDEREKKDNEDISAEGAMANLVSVGAQGNNGGQEDEVEESSVLKDVELEAGSEGTDEVALMLPDELLMECFLHALRLSVKDRNLPLHSNVFYGKHVLSFVPSNQYLDIRKTTFKKFSAFLNCMSDEGLIKVNNEKDGVQILESVNRSHDRIRQFQVHLKQIVDEPTEDSTKSWRPTYVPPEIDEVWFVVDKVLSLFSLWGHQKGDALTAGEVKHYLTNYVKENNLHSEDDRNFVILDPLLQRVLFRNSAESLERMLWRDVSVRLLSQMTEGYRMTFPGEDPLFKKTKVPSMNLTVETRGGKKQVTLIAGAENFRVHLGELARLIQHGRACSASVTENKRGQIVVQAQGDQRSFVCKLLTESYQLPKKYIEGYEDATKKKKRKR